MYIYVYIGECFKTLLGGVMMSDRVVTVSPSYREEICTPMGGWGLVASPRYQPPPPMRPCAAPLRRRAEGG